MHPVKFAVLGPMQVSRGGTVLKLGGHKQRLLLGMLACNANELVTTERLIEVLWGIRPPRTAEQNLRVYVYHLRKILGSNQRIVWRTSGYALTIAPGELDIDLFEDLAARGRRAFARNSADQAAGLLHRALELWRGAALGDLLDAEPLRARAVRLEERRLAVLEKRITIEIALGLHAELVEELRALAAEQPLREHTQAQLMVALYRSGRRAEALGVYRTVRRTLIDELGVDPGTELQQLHQAILSDDTALCEVLFPPAPQAETQHSHKGEIARIRDALALIGRLVDGIEATLPGDQD